MSLCFILGHDKLNTNDLFVWFKIFWFLVCGTRIHLCKIIYTYNITRNHRFLTIMLI